MSNFLRRILSRSTQNNIPQREVTQDTQNTPEAPNDQERPARQAFLRHRPWLHNQWNQATKRITEALRHNDNTTTRHDNNIIPSTQQEMFQDFTANASTNKRDTEQPIISPVFTQEPISLTDKNNTITESTPKHWDSRDKTTSTTSTKDSIPDPSKIPPRLQIDELGTTYDISVDLLKTSNEDKTRISKESHDQLSIALEEFIENNQKQLAEAGYQKRQHIYNTRPKDRKKFNKFCKEQYNKRYRTKVVCTDQENGQFTIYSRVRGARDYCYKSTIDLKTGDLTIHETFKTRPINRSYSDEGEAFARGKIDDELKIEGTSPLPHSAIAHNHIEAALEAAQKRNLHGFNTDYFDIQRITVKDCINRKTQSAINCLRDIKGQNDTTFEETFIPGSKGYDGLITTPNSSGSWYLIEHHYKNKAIDSEKMKKYIDKEHTNEPKYDLTFNIKNLKERSFFPYQPN